MQHVTNVHVSAAATHSADAAKAATGVTATAHIPAHSVVVLVLVPALQQPPALRAGGAHW